MNYHHCNFKSFHILLWLVGLLCIHAATKNIALNSEHDIAISMISHSIGGNSYQNQLTLDVSSSSMIHHTWHDTIRIQVVTGDNILCDSPIVQLTKGKFACMLDNHMLLPGDNIFSVTIYDANTHQIYFERETHFYFDGADDLHAVSNNIYLWHWPDAFALTTPKKVLLGGSLLFLAAVYAKNSYKPAPTKPAFVPVVPYKPRYPLIDVKSIINSPSISSTIDKYRCQLHTKLKKLQSHLHKIDGQLVRKNGIDLMWKVGKIAAVGVGVSAGRIVAIKGITFVLTAIPLFIGMTLRQPTRLLQRNTDKKAKEMIPTSPMPSSSPSEPIPIQHPIITWEMPVNLKNFHFHVITMPDGKKIVKSSIWWLEWLGTTVLLTNTGDPYFLKQLRKFLGPDIDPDVMMQ